MILSLFLKKAGAKRAPPFSFLIMRFKFILKLFSLLILGLFFCFLVLWWIIPLPLAQVLSIPSSPALYDTNGTLYHTRLSGESEWSLPIPLNEMGDWLPLVAVGVEDRRFYTHPGIDIWAIGRAAYQNALSRRVVSGASTITTQVIRLSVSERSHRPRSFSTKIQEFILALKLERAVDKKGIIETYLNLAPFGGNIRGVQAASLIYFGKPAKKLSPGEACLLIGMLKGPSLYRPDRRPEAAKKRRDSIIHFLAERKDLTPHQARLALLEELPSRWNSPPMKAFHYAELILNSFSSLQLEGRVDTTLNLDHQRKLEAILDRTIASLPLNVTAAAGIVDNRTGALLAWVGNARFARGGLNAWVDCGRALRSPGSALKPFAYLSAFDKGLLTPSTLLADSPLAFSGRAPRNFDLTYRGVISTRVALSDSLNAPAVRVLRMINPEEFLQTLRSFGFKDLNERAVHYGDSLILGGCEVSVLQMLEAYSALARLGLHRPLALLKNDYQSQGDSRLASPAASWMVADILNNKGRLSALTREAMGSEWNVAFKTGTSYGLRDAWTAAWTPDYTTVVWVGDPSGTPWPGLVGIHVAAPTALQILRSVSPKSTWYQRPDSVALREVCSLSGRPPTAACLNTRMDWYIEGVSQTLPCNIHVILNGKPSMLWPSELATPESPQGIIRKRPGIAITSPLANAVYYLAPLAKEQKIPMKVEGAIDKVWWYLDGEYIGTSLPNETFFHIVPSGNHLISASDGEGRTAGIKVDIVSPGKKENSKTQFLR